VKLSLKQLLLVGQVLIASRKPSFSNKPQVINPKVLPPRGNTRIHKNSHHRYASS
jgi:hypothetical protein